MQSKYHKLLVSLAKQRRREMIEEEQHWWYDFLGTYPVIRIGNDEVRRNF